LRFARIYWEDRGYDALAERDCWHVRTQVTRLKRGVMGAWHPAWPCTIWLSNREGWSGNGDRAPWWNVCATVIHEYGHLLGKRHNSNPESIMASPVNLNYDAWWYPWFPGCHYDGDDEDGDGNPDW
jgi:hypothetical protein